MKLERNHYLLAAAAALFITAILFPFLRSTTDTIVRKRFKQLAGTVEKDEKSGIINAAGNILKLEKMFADPTFLDLNYDNFEGEYDDNGLAREIERGRMMFEWMTLDFSRFEINESSPDRVDVVTRAHLLGRTKDGEAVDEKRDVDVTLIKEDGKWLFQSFYVNLD